MIIRPVEDSDREMIAGWIAREPSHSQSTPEFYFEPGTKSVLYSDDAGPVLVVRYSTAIRCDVDFNKDAGKDRIRRVLKEEFPGVAEQAKSQGFIEIVYNSTSKTLIAFTRLLGFRAVPDYRKTL
jgi:hypothetical protein